MAQPARAAPLAPPPSTTSTATAMRAILALATALLLASLTALRRTRSPLRADAVPAHLADAALLSAGLADARAAAAAPLPDRLAEADPSPTAPLPRSPLTCSTLATDADLRLAGEMRDLVLEGGAPHVTVTLATLPSIPLLELHLESLHNRAPRTARAFVVACAGRQTLEQCRRLVRESRTDLPLKSRARCVLDDELAARVDVTKSAPSMGVGSHESGVTAAYMAIIWRKPELMQLALDAGAAGVTFVDADGVWFSDPPPRHESRAMPSASSEFVRFDSGWVVDANACTSARIFRHAPLIFNSGTVHVPGNAAGRELLRRWLDARGRFRGGVCPARGAGGEDAERASGTVSRDDAFLDQDGLNLAICDDVLRAAQTTGNLKSARPLAVRIMTTSEVLLNSVHSAARRAQGFSICLPWFFHATNCGDDKRVCLLRNLERRDQARCGEQSRAGVDAPSV